ncbi:hypothetical protein [Anaerocolumna xylanovorans]|nr:hypothetical protein [Anaerocolumna xylanovorans]
MKKLLRKGTAAMLVAMGLFMAMSFKVSAATTELMKDGEFPTGGFINAGEAVDGTVQGPGNWTQLNMGDAEVSAPYLHVVVKATGDTAKAQIAVSDTYTFNLADLGVTLTEDYQDVVLPVKDQGITTIGWVNLTGLDGGSSVYTVKEIFLSDDAASTLGGAAVTEDAKAADTTAATDTAVAAETPKTGESATLIYICMAALVGCTGIFAATKKVAKAK